MQRRLVDLLLWGDAHLLHPLHYLHPTLCQGLVHLVCYPLERRWERLQG